MAVIPNTPVTYNGDGIIHSYLAMATGDTTSPITLVNAQVEISVALSGTIGGSTVTVKGTLDGTNWFTLDDAFGVAMSYTAIGILKPVGPSVVALRCEVAGGAGVSVNVYILVRQKVRP